MLASTTYFGQGRDLKEMKVSQILVMHGSNRWHLQLDASDLGSLFAEFTMPEVRASTT